ncbi:dihydropteroate synthase [Desulfosarcina alkanivorans]|uniref:Dihydropteroate synthase n=1 Tax=Desulfosarcina alkanivorans TaxID=571177 RepID=A0A5K7Z517_9BACT|nr:dihydropteroate synthase [Desulfosarcina alkanivorans]BBO71707.1 dihydropteroate synthase [Desulfosarcina alkanivorans]
MQTYTVTCGSRTLELGSRTLIMGIVNITPDSFSDGGRFFSPDRAMAQALQLMEEGADILDVGGESTRPFSDPVGESEELDRVLPVIEGLANRVSVPISIDTTKASVARQAVAAGATMINDISALRMDPEMASTAARCGVPLILMHMKGSPKDMQVAPVYSDLIPDIMAFLSEARDRAVAAGVDRGAVILDPGIGFGKTIRHNLQIIRDLNRFHELGAPLLVGPSRKMFIRQLLKDPSEKDMDPLCPEVARGTQAAVAAIAMQGAHVVRVHDVALTRDTLSVINAIASV